MNFLEWSGFIIFILGFVFQLLKDQIDTPSEMLTAVLNQHQIMYWLGLGLWAIGYLGRENKNKKDNPKL